MYLVDEESEYYNNRVLQITEAGRIVKTVSSCYEVLATNQKRVLCVATGKLRKVHSPVVGDLVEFERLMDQNGIQKILPRESALICPSIANVDQMIIVMSYRGPDFSTTLIDRLIFSVCYTGIRPVLCITKLDLTAENDVIHEEVQHYIDSGYEVYQSGRGYVSEDLIQALKGNISISTGQNGAGKDSPLDRIDPAFHPQTQETNRALGRGKYTMRCCELHEIAGGQVVDTPGSFLLGFTTMDITQLAGCIPSFQNVRDAYGFCDCIHVNEPDCAICAVIGDGTICRERYAYYLETVDTIQRAKPRYRNSIQEIQYSYEGGHTL